MANIETLKALVAPFVQLDPALIGAQTIIDRRAIKGSIMVHRMFAVLEREGFAVADRTIGTFGELAAALGKEEGVAAPASTAAPPPPVAKEKSSPPETGRHLRGLLAVGIDMEEVSNMPVVADFREEPFYRQNFSEREIAYCILQPDPRQSFAGRFCAKEAICKADRDWRRMPFNLIEIRSDAEGRPYFEGFALSISHTPAQAIAIALKSGSSGKEWAE
jgi:phosphopantetheine--protein transferase-like protein